MTVLILGAGGLLGSAFVRAGFAGTVIKAGRRDLFANTPSALVGRSKASVVVNCAADTDVDGAEQNPTVSQAANAVLPGLLAEACRENGSTLVHVSSTGCYGASEMRPYIEDDVPLPTTVHHQHKLEGEERVRASGCDALILRTGWLFGGRPEQSRNFVWNRMLEANSNSRIVSDPYQVGNPTWIGDVVLQAIMLLERNVRGTFNCVSAPAISRMDYVRAIVSASGIECKVVASEMPFKRLARVSPNEAADNERLRLLGVDIMPTWNETLPQYIASLIDTEDWRSASRKSEARI